MHNTAHLLKYAWQFALTPYSWGGDDPTGLDCSGFVVECLKSIGKLKAHEDLSADGLWKRFKLYEHHGKPKPCCLAFWFTGDRATHVAICLDDEFCLIVEGGGSTTHTPEDAANANAFIKLRPIYGIRKANPKFINLF